MFLPNQYGVYEQEKGIEFPRITSESEYKSLLELFHAHDGLNGYQTGIKRLKDKQCITDWAFWFARNRMIDSISTFYEIVTKKTLTDLKVMFKNISELSYRTLKESWFLTELQKRNLVIPPDIQAALEETYKQANILDK